MNTLAVRFDPQSPWWPRLLLLAGALLALWFGLRVLWLLVAGPELPPPPATPIAAASTEARPTGSIAQWRLFGQAAPAIDPRLLAERAPETALRLTLRGTLSEDAPDGGIAIIADEHGGERRYRVGDALPGGATLDAIYAGRVLLSRNGAAESLSLPRVELAPRAAAGRAGNVPLPGQPQVAPFVNPVISTGAPVQETQRAQRRPDIERLAREVSVMPAIENGRMVGVRLSVPGHSDLLARSGLRPTDIITAVNGIPLDGPQRQAELIASLGDARQVTLSVRRDGETLQIPVGF